MKKDRIIRIISLFSITLLGVGAILRFLTYPNQLLFFIPGLLISIFFLVPAVSVGNLKESNSLGAKVFAILGGISLAVLLVVGPLLVMENSTLHIAVTCISLVIVLFNSRVYNAYTKKFTRLSLLFVISLSLLNAPIDGQVPDKFYDPEIENPKYRNDNGPIVYVDEAHNNFHTLSGRYWVFGEVLRNDGYRTAPFTTSFTDQSLADVEILVISNALNEKNIENWYNPTYPAFTETEIEAIEKWVEEGGSLWLIADHMPMGGAAYGLAKIFGFEFSNGFAIDTLNRDDYFTFADSSLIDNEITQSANFAESIDSVITFTGQAFSIPEKAVSILRFNERFLQWEPDTAWRFENTTPYDVKGYSQGAYLRHGNGKVVVFGEAAMFSSQLGWGLSWRKFGLANPKSKGNLPLLLNVIHWLDD